MIPLLEDCTLQEKQQYYFNGAYCPFCRQESQYVDSKIVYQQSHGMIHFCPDCKAWCGCHNGSDQAFGFLAKKPLRDLRHRCHEVFDPLWQLKVKHGAKRKSAQLSARNWLASTLGIDPVACHFGMFDEELCKRTIGICEDLMEELRDKDFQRQIVTQERIGAFMFQCARLGLGYKDFNINGKQQYELVHEGKGQCLKFFPSKNEIQWDNGKVTTIENIETFIAENFKITEDAK